jgi:hypothetical protein
MGYGRVLGQWVDDPRRINGFDVMKATRFDGYKGGVTSFISVTMARHFDLLARERKEGQLTLGKVYKPAD